MHGEEGPGIAEFSPRFGDMYKISKHPKQIAVGQVLGNDRDGQELQQYKRIPSLMKSCTVFATDF